MEYLKTSTSLSNIFNKAEEALLNGIKIKFQKLKSWREQVIPNFPGVYALYENTDSLLYIGETGNLQERMSDICRTVNHTFRRQLGHNRFGGIKTKKKFDPDVEQLLDLFFEKKLHVAFIKVNFGRVEIETHLVTKYQKTLLNSEKKRKLKLELDALID